MENIIAKQGYASKEMKEFKFIQRFNLASYLYIYEPLVVFGVYLPEDREVIRFHKGKLIVWWQGVDSKDVKNPQIFQKPNVVNISEMQNIVDYLRSKEIPCHLSKPCDLIGNQKPVIKGKKVYAYINPRKPEYYGLSLIESLYIPFEVLIANFKFGQDEWYGGRNDEYFSQCFVGLALSDYAGGGSSIVECGLKGLKCITNLIDMPNTIRWKTKADIETAIITESAEIGTIDNDLSKTVHDYVYRSHGEFNLNKILN